MPQQALICEPPHPAVARECRPATPPPPPPTPRALPAQAPSAAFMGLHARAELSAHKDQLGEAVGTTPPSPTPHPPPHFAPRAPCPPIPGALLVATCAAGFGLSNYTAFRDPINLPKSHLYSLNDEACSARCATLAAQAGNQTGDAAPAPAADAGAPPPQQQQPGRRLAQSQARRSSGARGLRGAKQQQQLGRRLLVEGVYSDYMASLLKAPADVENAYATRRQLSHGGCGYWHRLQYPHVHMRWSRALGSCCPGRGPEVVACCGQSLPGCGSLCSPQPTRPQIDPQLLVLRPHPVLQRSLRAWQRRAAWWRLRSSRPAPCRPCTSSRMPTSSPPSSRVSPSHLCASRPRRALPCYPRPAASLSCAQAGPSCRDLSTDCGVRPSWRARQAPSTGACRGTAKQAGPKPTLAPSAHLSRPSPAGTIDMILLANGTRKVVRTMQPGDVAVIPRGGWGLAARAGAGQPAAGEGGR